MPNERPHFYTELVITTSISLAVAAIWIEVVKGGLNRFFKDDLRALLFCAVAATLLAIKSLHYLFSLERSQERNRKEN